MIKISSNLSLNDIGVNDSEKLLKLMEDIYPPVYAHLWPDGGVQYLKMICSPENLKTELSNPNSRYYFVNFQNTTIGILRILLNESFKEIEDNYSVKLHRVYLSPRVHGKGIGKTLINWIENQFCVPKKAILWLEVMDTQEQALKFYKKLDFKIINHFNFELDLMLEKYRGMYKMVKHYS